MRICSLTCLPAVPEIGCRCAEPLSVLQRSFDGISGQDAIEDLQQLKLAALRQLVSQHSSDTLPALERVDLRGITLTDINLTGANLRAANLAGCALVNCDLSAACLDHCILDGGQMSESFLINASMVNCQLTRCDLRHAALNSVDLTAADCHGSDFSVADLSLARLDRANLAGSNLSGALLYRTSMVGCQLAQADMHKAVLHYTRLDGSDLTDARLKGVELQGASFTGVTLNTIITLDLPAGWQRPTLHEAFHPGRGEGNLLTAIDSIENRYQLIKTHLAAQLIRSLTAADIDTSTVTPQLLATLSKWPFCDFPPVTAFINRTLQDYLAYCQHAAMPNVNQALLSAALGFYRTNLPLSLTPSHQGAFIQVIAAAVIRTEFTAAAQALYHQYLQQPAISALKHSPAFSVLYGDCEGQPDWSTPDACNLILCSAQPAGPAMLLSLHALRQMLTADHHSVWTNFHLYQHNLLRRVNDTPLDSLFSQHFPLFINSYRQTKRSFMLLPLIEALDLNQQLKKLFLDATESPLSSIKLVDQASEATLKAAFNSKLVFAASPLGDCRLNSEHYNEIITIYNLAQSGDRDKAIILLSLATVFARYASDEVFGEYLHSPNTLRYYTLGLMTRAYELDPSLFDKQVTPQIKVNFYPQFRKLLLGLEPEYTCCGSMATIMISLAKKTHADTLTMMTPPAWR